MQKWFSSNLFFDKSIWFAAKQIDLVICESINSNFQDTLSPICNCGNMLNLLFIISFTLSYIVMNVAHSRLVQSDNTDFSLTQILLLGNITFNTKVNTKIINLTTTLFCQLRDLMSRHYGLYIFFLSSPLNNDLSAKKKILSEASPGLLGHQQLFTS